MAIRRVCWQRVSCHLHDQRAAARLAGRSILALADRWVRRDSLESRQRRHRTGRDVWHVVFHPRFWSGSAKAVMAQPRRPFWLTFSRSKSAGESSRSFARPSRSESALGYVLGGQICGAICGMALGLLSGCAAGPSSGLICFLPAATRRTRVARPKSRRAAVCGDYLAIFRTRSFHSIASPKRR